MPNKSKNVNMYVVWYIQWMGKDLHVLIRSFEFCLIDKHRSTKEENTQRRQYIQPQLQSTNNKFFRLLPLLYSPCLLILLLHCCFHLFVDCNKQLWKIFFFSSFFFVDDFFLCCSIFACLHKSHQANSPQCFSSSSYFFFLLICY